MDVTAVYELPVPIWVTSSALGKRFPTGHGRVTFDVVMPIDDPPHGAPPDIEGVDTRADLTDETLEWASGNYAGFIPPSLQPAVLLFRVGIANVAAPEPLPQFAWNTADSQLADAIGGWFNEVRTWAEAMTGQDLDPHHRVYSVQFHGDGLTFIEPPLDETGVGFSTSEPSVLPVSADRWATVLRAVRDGLQPPLEELLSRDTRAAQARGQHRRAVIDAATAVEIVLARYLRDRAAELPERQQGRLAPSRKPSLGTYISIAEESKIAFTVPYDKLKQLVDLRNNTAHHGKNPGDFETVKAVQTMIDFLGSHGPWKRVAEREPDGSEWVIASNSTGTTTAGP